MSTTDPISRDLLKTYLGLTDAAEDSRLEAIIGYVSKGIARLTGREFGSTSYSKERHNGNGLTKLRLNHYPVTTVDRLSTEVRDCLDVTNASATSGAKHAYAKVTTTELQLILVGGDNAGTDSITLADYPTMADLAAAIDGVGKGWDGGRNDAASVSYSASDLLPTYGRLYALDETVRLQCAGEPAENFALDDGDAGIVYCDNGFTEGTRNIIVDYTAGYTTIPDDIQHAAALWCGAVYHRAKEGADGFDAEKMPELSQSYRWALPPEVEATLTDRRDILI